MNKRAAFLCIAFANGLLLGQTSSPAEAAAPVITPRVNRLEQLSKRFPPEIVPAATPGRATLLGPYCVYPSVGAPSLSFKPCRTESRKLRLVPPFESIPGKPTPPPGNIR